MKIDLYEIKDRISDIIKEFSFNEDRFLDKQSIAIAYANLLLEDPELVTDRHIRMLQKELTSDQIIAITHCVLEQVGENAYVNAFRLRCTKILSEDPIKY